MERSQSFSVVADDRESAGAVLAALRRRAGVQVRVERLPVGDYRVDEALLFERKTLLDLVASIKDGRLFTQGLRLANAPLRAALILEGRSQDLAESQMRREAIQGALVALTLFLGLPLLRSMDPEETASLILFAARQGRAVRGRHAAPQGPAPARQATGSEPDTPGLAWGRTGAGEAIAGTVWNRRGGDRCSGH